MQCLHIGCDRPTCRVYGFCFSIRTHTVDPVDARGDRRLFKCAENRDVQIYSTSRYALPMALIRGRSRTKVIHHTDLFQVWYTVRYTVQFQIHVSNAGFRPRFHFSIHISRVHVQGSTMAQVPSFRSHIRVTSLETYRHAPCPI